MPTKIRLSPHPSDAERAALAALQAASWRSAYRGILPDAFLDAPAQDLRGLAARLEAEWAGLSLAAEDLLLTAGPEEAPEEAPVEATDAFAVILADPGASRTVEEVPESSSAAPAAAHGEAARPYLDHLHVRPEARGRGLGEALLRDAARRLVGRGAGAEAGLWLWVFEANAGARRFYARLGAAEELRAEKQPYGQSQPCVRLGWDGPGLAALAAP